MKIITNEQINALLQAFYEANPSVKMFEGVKKLLSELPDIVEPKAE